MMRRTALTLLLALAGGGMPAAAEDFVLIVNGANPTTKISKQEAARLFLKQTAVWGNGAPVVPVDLDARSPTRAVFSKVVHGRPVGAVQSYWNLKAFSGAVVPPTQKTVESQVVQFVAANAGAVGYVSAGTALQGVKAVQLVD